MVKVKGTGMGGLLGDGLFQPPDPGQPNRHCQNLIAELITNLTTLSNTARHLGTDACRKIFWWLGQITPNNTN